MDNEQHGKRWTRREALIGGAAVVSAASLLTGCANRPDTSALRKRADAVPETDPALVQYREIGRMEPGIEEPTGIAVTADGPVWFVGKDRMVLYRDDGPGESQPLPGRASCVAVHGDRLFVGIGSSVYVRSGDRPLARWLDLGERSVVTCITPTADQVLIADSGERRIVRCAADGRTLGYLCEKDASRGYTGLVVPSPHLDVVVGADHAIHVVNPGTHTIEVYDPDGNPRYTWGDSSQAMEGFCGCCNPTDIALLEDGRYVTSEKGIPRVKVYSALGHFEAVVTGPEGLSAGAVGLDVAGLPDGRIAVLDPGIGAVRIFERKGDHA